MTMRKIAETAIIKSNLLMKESYYTDISIDQQSHVFLEKIKPLREKHPYQINPQVAALLIIDCQEFFFNQTSHAFIPSAGAIIPRISRLQKHCFQSGIKIIKTQHINTPENASMMLKWWGNHLPYVDNHLVAIIPEIADVKESAIIKSQYDAFYNSTLDSVLRANGIKQLIITGVMAHLCCETTARVAFTRGYEVFFSIDGTATYNQEFHLGTLINLAHGFAIPMLTAEIIDQLSEK
jgi:isochorismate hydrolase